MITRSFFAQLHDGRNVFKYRITNDFGEFVEILDYGACIYSLNVPDWNGTLGDVVLGVRSPDEIETGHFAGITIGRCANRIADGKFLLNGDIVQLEQNQGRNHLHGGSGNYGHKLFQEIPSASDNQLSLHLTDEGLGGYNNRVHVTVTFSFGNDHSLKIHYRMVGEAVTLLCPTNHAYFNLDGTADICNHILQIPAELYAVKGKSGMPEGEKSEVAGTPLDFRQPHPIGDAFVKETASFFPHAIPEIDDTFLLNSGIGKLRTAARLESPVSGRGMEICTDMPALIAFTMFIRNPVIGKNETTYSGYKAIALETQYVPNAINCSSFDKPLFSAGQVMESETIYQFYTITERE